MTKDIQKKIAGILQNDSDIAAVYLFGSQAKNKGHKRSDIDLAILFKKKLSTGESFQRMQNYFIKLSRLLGHELDLVDLEKINLILSFEVLHGGKILIENDCSKNRNFIAQKMIEYFDFEFNLKQCMQGMYLKAMEKRGA